MSKRIHGGEAEATVAIAITEEEATAADTYRRSVFGKSKYYKPTTASVDDSTPPPVPAHVHYDYTDNRMITREYDRADHKLRRMKEPHECVTMWSFVRIDHGMKTTSALRFETAEQAMDAINKRMLLHAEDNDFPLFALKRFRR